MARPKTPLDFTFVRGLPTFVVPSYIDSMGVRHDEIEGKLAILSELANSAKQATDIQKSMQAFFDESKHMPYVRLVGLIKKPFQKMPEIFLPKGFEQRRYNLYWVKYTAEKGNNRIVLNWQSLCDEMKEKNLTQDEYFCHIKAQMIILRLNQKMDTALDEMRHLVKVLETMCEIDGIDRMPHWANVLE